MPNLTYNDVLSAYAHYPAPIRPYLLRAETHPVLRSVLTKSFMRIVIDILARAPIADPMRALKLRVDIIAHDLDVSCKTVTRALNVLRSHGWISRLPGTDGRNNWGEFCAGEFILADALRALLGLPTTQPTPVASHVVPDAEALPSSHVAADVSGHALQPVENTGHHQHDVVDNFPVETEMSDGLYRVNKVLKKEASFSKEASDSKTIKTNSNTPKFKVPADLVSLQTELSLHPFGVFKLIALAKQAKQRLQDVWTAKREQLLSSGARAGRAFRYLAFLLQTGEDFAFIATKKTLPTKPASAGQALGKPVAAVDHRMYWNKKFVGHNGLCVRIHGDGSADLSDSTRTDAYICPGDMGHVYAAIAAGKLWLLDE